MKIAIILFPQMEIFGLIAAYEPLAHVYGSTTPDSIDFCSPATFSDPPHGISLHPLRTPSSLDEYDAIVIPASISENPLLAEDFITWLSTARACKIIAALGDGAKILLAAGFIDKIPLFEANQDIIQPQEDILIAPNEGGSARALGLKLATSLGNMGSDSPTRQKREDQPAAQNPDRHRWARVLRETRETRIQLELRLDGSGISSFQTGLGFLDHMCSHIAVHGLFDLSIQAQGDLEVDPHHTVEDVALALGEAFREALGDRKGIQRMGSATVPMDESLATVTVDFSGRPYCVLHTQWNSSTVGNIPTSLIDHFLESFAFQSRCNLHVQVLYGKDDHHMAEAIFKALGRALSTAVLIDPRRLGSIPSTKGILF